MAAALILETSAFGLVGSSPTWGTNFSHAQVAKRSKASDCKSDRETSREFNPRPVLHFFSFHASVAHLDRAPGYEPGGGKFKSFQTHHFFRTSKQGVCGWLLTSIERGSMPRYGAILMLALAQR